MKGPWKALAAFAAIAATTLILSASALAVGGGSRPAPTTWKIKLAPATWSGRLTALYPGAANDTEVFPFTVTNDGRATARLFSISVSIPTTAGGDAETANGAAIRGCRGAWFSVSLDARDRSLPRDIAGGATYSGKVDLSMRASPANQNACARSAPAFTVLAR